MPGLLSTLACIWVPVAAIRGAKATLASSRPVYTHVDDASWAIYSHKASDRLSGHIPSLYASYIEECTKAAMLTSDPTACQHVEDFRLNMNVNQPKSVYNYTEVGYKKIKAPAELYKLIRDFYDKHLGENVTEWKSVNSYHNMWESPPSFISLLDDQMEGGGPELRQQIQSIAKSVLQEWSGQELSLVSLYGVRLYHNGSILAPQ
jgi:prolyl 4-hydroxylase